MTSDELFTDEAYFRHIHEYFGVNYEVVWETIKEDLPKLKAAVEKSLMS